MFEIVRRYLNKQLINSNILRGGGGVTIEKQCRLWVN